MKKLMIYGATGYTGRMAAKHAAAAGTPLTVAGRHAAALAELATRLESAMEQPVNNFIRTANAFDVDAMLALFSANAVIDDVSVGEAFAGAGGVRRYLEQYFVGYRTTTGLLALKQINDLTASARVDFTGDFGHETGWLRISLGAGGLIERIDAELE